MSLWCPDFCPWPLNGVIHWDRDQGRKEVISSALGVCACCGDSMGGPLAVLISFDLYICRLSIFGPHNAIFSFILSQHRAVRCVSVIFPSQWRSTGTIITPRNFGHNVCKIYHDIILSLPSQRFYTFRIWIESFNQKPTRFRYGGHLNVNEKFDSSM